MVGCGSEVDEVSKSPSHSYCELDDTVDGLDGSGGQLGIEVGEDAIQSVPIRESGDSHLTHKKFGWHMESQIACCRRATIQTRSASIRLHVRA